MMASAPSILLTRPSGAAEGFARQLADAGVQGPVVISPLLQIETLEAPDMAGAAGAIFTSKNGVAAVQGRDLRAWCVGDATARAATDRGWRAVSAGGDAEALYRRVLADAPEGPLWHLRGEHARGDLAARLNSSGITVQEAVVYRQRACALNAAAKHLLSGRDPVIIPLFSPRTARQLVSQAPFSAPVLVAAISPAVVAEVVNLDCRARIVAARPEADAMIEATQGLFDAACRIEDRGKLA